MNYIPRSVLKIICISQHACLSFQATLIVMQLGQFLDHDISFTPEEEIELEECCQDEKTGKAQDGCFSIATPCGDDQFEECASDVCSGFIPLTRSVSFCEAKATKTRNQMNGITAFVDASNVYGSEEDVSRILRTFNGGMLKVGQGNLLPIIDAVQMAGDVRSLENPGLASLHTVFLREHNRIATALKVIHNSLNDEELYQKTRRIVGAEWQNVVYGQYLLELVGPEMYNHYQLNLTSNSAYNTSDNPSVTNEFATAAYRFV
jgi:peroxidase